LAHAARVAFVVLAVAALLAVSFLIGRSTVGTEHKPAIASTAPPSAAPTNFDSCHFGPPC
jgi:hypothetical protein